MVAKRTTRSLGIADLLKLRGFAMNEPAKLVRHQDRRYDVNDLVRRGWFDFYQATQGKPRFRQCKHIISFIGAGGTKARFVGVYRVVEERDGTCVKPPKGYAAQLSHYRYYYALERETGYGVSSSLRGNLAAVPPDSTPIRMLRATLDASMREMLAVRAPKSRNPKAPNFRNPQRERHTA